MTGAKKTFLLPCVGCACDIDVVAGQAGGPVQCPSCGSPNEVPKFRDLGRLRIKPDATVGQSRQWGLSQAVALAGVASAALAWGTAAVVGSTPTSVFDPAMIRANVDAGDDAALYRSLQEYAASTVDRDPFRGEVELQRRARFAQGMSRTLYALGGLGAIAAAVAGFCSLAPGKRT